jgi:hypothetical protein
LKIAPAYYKAGVEVENSGPNPTTSIYNAGVVEIYDASNSLARFYSKNHFSPI